MVGSIDNVNTGTSRFYPLPSASGIGGGASNSAFQDVLNAELLKANQKTSGASAASAPAPQTEGSSVMSFLRSSYVGQTIMFSDGKRNIIGKGRVNDFVVGDEGYYFLLNNDIKVKVLFEAYQLRRSHIERRYAPYRDRAQKRLMLSRRASMEQFKTAMIDGIFSETAVDTSGIVGSMITPEDQGAELGRIEYYDFASKATMGPKRAIRAKSASNKFITMLWVSSSKLWPVATLFAFSFLTFLFIRYRLRTPQIVHDFKLTPFLKRTDLI